ncbi:hypothetical protein ROZALSC1DRAFT_29974 [Rozella allomycis CSF55]|uniref:GST C-terminal domain-containing protein n=1 Tax=Rozella allomycis (strain CSF55) TaxID=988480 RepID=A0A4P9YGI5_ROZAC|nr:hypothetical protein ROZALSC1DRAFT_29974 [Rozella allomycis CSF55]
MSSILKWANEKGEFVRQTSSFRNYIEKGSLHPPQANRYILYISLACPWAHRALIARKLKGLEDCIGLSIVDYLMSDQETETPGCIPDPLYGSKYLKDLYLRADPNYKVPVLWDRELNTIVNNESSEIIRIFNHAFDEWSSSKDFTLYPEKYSKDIDEMNTWIYDLINNGVYKAGFATNQDVLFEGLDRVEEILMNAEYLVGGVFTEADLRFEPVYFGHFKCNLKSLRDYPNIMKWTKRIMAIKGIKETVNMEHIKRVLIAAAVRTPVGSFCGQFSSLSAPELASVAIKEALNRSKISPDIIDEVFLGHVLSANVGQLPAKQAALLAHIPASVPCSNIGKVCSSGMKGGMESMSNCPFYSPEMRSGAKYGHKTFVDGVQRDGLTDAANGKLMGECAEITAEEYQIGRKEQVK